MISVHLITSLEGEPMVKLTRVKDKVTQTWIMNPDDAAFLFFDLDEVLKAIRERTQAP